MQVVLFRFSSGVNKNEDAIENDYQLYSQVSGGVLGCCGGWIHHLLNHSHDSKYICQ